MKKIDSIFRKCCMMLFAALFLSSNLLAQDLTDGLLLHYTFDGDAGTTVTDVSARGNNGTIYGNGYISDNGKEGKALHLPTTGMSGADVDYVHITNGITTNLTSYTIATWVNIETISTWARIFDFGDSQADNMFLTASQGSYCRFAIKAENGSEQMINGSALWTNDWIHLAVTYDFLTSTGRLYVNGFEVGSNSEMTITPSNMAGSTQNFIGRAQYPDPGFVGYIDDFRIYEKTLSHSDILALAGVSMDVFNAFSDFEDNSILNGNISLREIDGDLDLPTSTFGDVTMTWESSNTDVITTDGKVTMQESPVTVTLTVTFSKEGSNPLKKEITVIVIAAEPLQTLIAKWQFTSGNIKFENNEIVVRSDDDPYIDQDTYFTGTLKNNAQIRVIGGGDNMFNVLDLGGSSGYMDMGEEIGKYFYKLTDYTVGGYFFVPEDAPNYADNGNFICTFSNTADGATDQTGYMFIRPYAVAHSISQVHWSAAKGVGLSHSYYAENSITYLGTWHHVLYTQQGTTGSIYIDGQLAKSDEVTLLPIDIKREGREGTIYNWLGRACFASDSYMKKALLYDFRLYSVGFSEDDISGVLDIVPTISALNAAYATNPNVTDETLQNAMNALAFNDMTDITGNITLPTSIDGFSDVTVLWSSHDEGVISSTGEFTAPLYDATIKLTATLVRNGKTLTKDFNISVKAATANPFTNDLVVHFDFSQVDGTIITDKAEQQLKGTLMNEAAINTLQTDEGNINVLNLGNGTGYLDMGARTGQILYNIEDYTFSAYFNIDEEYGELNNAGNFLWVFSNSENQASSASPYIIAILKDMRFEFRAKNEEGNYKNESRTAYESGNQNAEKGTWKHVAFTQSGTTGTIYVDGVQTNQVVMPYIPSVDLSMEGRSGTFYNWLGRPCYGADKYLRQTLVSDFRMYKRALSPAEFESALNVTHTLELLNNSKNITGIDDVKNQEDPYNVYFVNGQLVIEGLQGNEAVSLYDIMGRRYAIDGKTPVQINSGIYIVKINNFTKKVFVK